MNDGIYFKNTDKDDLLDSYKRVSSSKLAQHKQFNRHLEPPPLEPYYHWNPFYQKNLERMNNWVKEYAEQFIDQYGQSYCDLLVNRYLNKLKWYQEHPEELAKKR